MNKNTRWALAIVGVAILVIAAVIIGTGGDETNAPESGDTPAVEPRGGAVTPSTGATSAPDDNGGGSDSGGDTGGTPAEPGDDTGGTSPGDDTGGAKPEDNGGSGGAEAGTSSVTVLKSGSVKTVKAKKGDTVVFKVKSSEPEELHIHGYDKTVEVPANKTVTVKFKAKIDGIFDIEFHHSDEKIGTLKVTP